MGSTNNVAEKAEFTVTYENSGNLNDKFWYAWQTMLIVFEVVIAFPLFMWKMYRFLKKRKGEQADQVGDGQITADLGKSRVGKEACSLT